MLAGGKEKLLLLLLLFLLPGRRWLLGHCGFGALWAAMATAMAASGSNLFATAPGAARGPHTARQKKGSVRAKGGQRHGAAPAVLASVLLQGADKEWLQKMADTPLDKIQQIRDEARETVRSSTASILPANPAQARHVSHSADAPCPLLHRATTRRPSK
eukprot:COSAG02_NODE_30006_length_559_cov_0.558696_1_plen_159_part_00